MALFRRRTVPEGVEALADVPPGSDAPEIEDGVEAADASDQPDTAPAKPGQPAQGPFDESESHLADQDLPRLALGALLVPGLPDVELQLEADPNSQQVRALTAILADAGVQLQPVAAPRTEGLWDEMRAEIVEELNRTKGAKVSQAEGEFGPEVRALVPATTPDGKQVMQQVRYAGVDGPRWMLRLVFLGRAAVLPDTSDALHLLVRQTIVVRGPDAMAPGDPLRLVLPEQPPAAPDEAVDEAGEDSEDAPEDRFDGLDPFERGPEITETR